MTESLSKKQRRFTLQVAFLIQEAYEQGYELTLGETWRTPEMAKFYAAQGKGISNSLHLSRLAIDLNLFKNGRWLTTSESHRPLGEWWEAQGTDHRWGGRWGDGNHYSIEHNGVK